ncbi:MAG: hypothetical protein AAGA03_04390 [Planctomycetota bacterium]
MKKHALSAVVDRRRAMRTRLTIAFLAACIVAVTALTASAQSKKYTEVAFKKPEIGEDAYVKQMQTAYRMLATARNVSDLSNRDKGLVANYLKEYVPQAITQEANRTEISKIMSFVMGQYRTAMMSLDARGRSVNADTIARLVYPGLSGIAKSEGRNFHPAARINAILAISQFNEGVANGAPVPMRSALPLLVSLYENEKSPDAVRAAALSGIERHSKWNFTRIDNATKTQILAAMNALLDQPVPEGRSPDAHAYLQRKAVNVIGSLGPQQDPVLGVRLVSISTEPTRSDLIALYSAAKVGQVATGMQGKLPAPVPDVLGKWTQRLHKAFESEAERLAGLGRPSPSPSQPKSPVELYKDKFMTKRVTSESGEGGYGGGYGADEGGERDDADDMDGGYGDEGYGGGEDVIIASYNEQPREVIGSRRYLNYAIQQVLVGATGSSSAEVPESPRGLLAAADEAGKAELTSWLASMATVVEELNNPEYDDRAKFIEALQAQTLALSEIGADDQSEYDSNVPDSGSDFLKGLLGQN